MRYVWEDSTWVKTKRGDTLVALFGRSIDDPYKTKVTFISGFEPYFYAPEDSNVIPKEVVRVDSDTHIDALGRRVRKMFTRLPSDVPVARKVFEWTDEADVMFDKRYVCDTHLQYAYEEDEYGDVHPIDVSTPLPPRILYFDIEVKSPPEILPLPEKSEWPIVSIQCADSYDREIKIFTFGVPQLASDQEAYQTERAMLAAFMDHVQRTDPDVLTGWYSNGFDIPYIINRGEVLGMAMGRLSRFKDSKPSADKRGFGWSIRITGRQCVDMLAAFRKWYKAEGELESYDLKSVATKFIGFTYTDYGAKIDELFSNSRWEEFLQYCRNDVIALLGIDEKIKLFDFYENLRMIAGIKLEETLMNSRMIESLLMRNGIKPMPTRQYGISSESYSGALVLTPTIGVHKDVAVFDLAALYPTIIIGFNVSPDVDKMIPKVIKFMIDEREKLRAIRMEGKADDTLKKKETVIKFIVNSFYGVLGWPGFRLYTPEMAEFITSTGRDINQFLQDCATKKERQTIYGDTDSIFVEGVESVSYGKELQDYFNEELVSWASTKGSSISPTIKFEKQYRRILFKKSSTGEGAAKKRYAGHLIWKDGYEVDKLDFTGIEIKRSDQSIVTKNVMTTFLDLLLLKDNEHQAVEEVRKVYEKAIHGELDPYDLSIPKGVKDLDGNNPWARGIKNTDDIFHVKVLTGQKPRLIYCKGTVTEICVTSDITNEMIEDVIEVDWKRMADKTIRNKMESFFESIGYTWDGVVNGQSRLGEWIWTK